MTLNNTSHPADEEFIEHLYALRMGSSAPGTSPVDTSLVGAHLASCDFCQSKFAAISRALAAMDAAPVPERGDAYGREVWQQLQPRLGVPSGFAWNTWFAPRSLV